MGDEFVTPVLFLDDLSELEEIVDDVLIFQEAVQDDAPVGTHLVPSQVAVIVAAPTSPEDSESPVEGVHFVISDDNGGALAFAVSVYGFDYVRKEPVEPTPGEDPPAAPAVIFTDDLALIEQLLIDSLDFQDEVPDATEGVPIGDVNVYLFEDPLSADGERKNLTITVLDVPGDDGSDGQTYIFQNNQTNLEFLL